MKLSELVDISAKNSDKFLSKDEMKFYTDYINSLMGNSKRYKIYCLLGARGVGKSYALSKKLCIQKAKYGDMVKAYWIRISDTSTKALLRNHAQDFIDPDLQRQYNLELSTKGPIIFNHGKEFCRCIALAGSGKFKGQAVYDKDFVKNGGRYFIVLDEMNLEITERKTFDIAAAFVSVLETLIRKEFDGVTLFLVGNTAADANVILSKLFNFQPEPGKFGRYKIPGKSLIVDYQAPSEAYMKMHAKSLIGHMNVADDASYSNQQIVSNELVFKGRVYKPSTIIKFSRYKKDWFTLWDGKVVKKFNEETIKTYVAMRPYLNSFYSVDRAKEIINIFDAQGFYFDNLATQAYFADELSKIRTK